ncbi:ATPase family gene 2 protein homolog A-like isoform X1 [Montipora foliosa]|uniref:ATPase family gene 2 protein homolog A-like isoform X1 n=2 Tax=Montipora foliosa TaxID=591990 RepID=UPI0035F21181
MSGKKKQDHWQLCESCGRQLYFRHLSDHRVLCEADRLTDPINHAFIHDGSLHAVALERNNNMMPDGKLPLSSRNDVILLNINTMRECNMSIGKRILVTSAEKSNKIVCIAWPASGVPPEGAALTCLSLLNAQVKVSDIIIISPLKELCLHALRVELELCETVEFEVNRMFVTYCLHELRNQFVFPMHKVEVNFLGKSRQLLVTSVKGSHHLTPELASSEEDKVSTDDSTTTELSNSLAALELDSASGSTNSVQICAKDVDLSGNKIPSSVSHISKDDNELSNGTTKEPIPGQKINRTQHNCAIQLSEEYQSQNCLDLWYQNKSSSTTVLFYISPEETQLIIHAQGTKQSKNVSRRKVTFDLIGGLQEQVKLVREMIELPLKHPDMFTSYGIPLPRGVLLYGPPGTGKTLIAQAVASESGAYFICINGPDVLSRYFGETEARLRDIFHEAHERAPSIVFIDELDALCPKRDKVQNEFEKRVVATLLTLMDGAKTANSSSGHVLVLAATNRPDALDPALRRPGRLDREIEIGIPNARDREDILRTLLRTVPHGLTTEDFRSFADIAHGYVGADLAAVCKEAGLLSFKRCLRESKVTAPPADVAGQESLKERLLVTREDIMAAFTQVRPSAMREVAIDVPKVRWEDIGGNAVIKKKLKQAVEWPLKHPQAFQRLGIRPPKGILMYGPPGCSKTLIARALATESGLNFLAVKGPELFSKWVGESERAVRQVFQKARAAAPSIIFFDEIDALATRRGGSGDDGASTVSDRVLTQLLTELDGVETLKDVVMVAATNRPDMIDKALLRPGRIDRILYVPLPDLEARKEIFKIHLSNTPVGDDVVIEELAERTEMFSGAEISALCREAALAALEENIESTEVFRRHFDAAFVAVKPRTSSNLIELYRKYQNESGIHSI